MSKQQAPVPAEETKATRTLTDGVTVGRAADRLMRLDNEEREALAQSPTAIKELFAKKRDAVLSGLSDAQRKGALAMAEAMKPSAEAAE
jgi:hypothetical protein